jgi:hypothetical protein
LGAEFAHRFAFLPSVGVWYCVDMSGILILRFGDQRVNIFNLIEAKVD